MEIIDYENNKSFKIGTGTPVIDIHRYHGLDVVVRGIDPKELLHLAEHLDLKVRNNGQFFTTEIDQDGQVVFLHSTHEREDLPVIPEELQADEEGDDS